MGKRIIQQRRGRGTNTYRVKNSASIFAAHYPYNMEGEWEVVNLVSCGGYSAPLAKIMNKQGAIFYNIAANHLYVGQKVTFGGTNYGDVIRLEDAANGAEVFNIEHNPSDGGKFARTGGNAAIVLGKEGNMVKVFLPSRQEKMFEGACRATLGRAAGQGRLEKPILKAGTMFYIKKSKSKLWPRTSAVKMNKIDHPFGSGRGKRIKSKIAKRNAPAGKKVGLLRPRRTGRKKR